MSLFTPNVITHSIWRPYKFMVWWCLNIVHLNDMIMIWFWLLSEIRRLCVKVIINLLRGFMQLHICYCSWTVYQPSAYQKYMWMWWYVFEVVCKPRNCTVQISRWLSDICWHLPYTISGSVSTQLSSRLKLCNTIWVIYIFTFIL
jgi:hypothetical protein